MQDLSEDTTAADPFQQFKSWFEDVLASGAPEPHAMVLATADRAARPSVRTVLLKGFDERGFVYYTGYESRKARELLENPRAALLFLWLAEARRQVRIEGHVERLAPEESDAYFRTRPRGSQLSAWASAQSEVIPHRQVLEERIRELALKYADVDIPRPPYWGGYRVVPEIFEFWQGRPDRLHDRLRYRPAAGGGWVIERLSP